MDSRVIYTIITGILIILLILILKNYQTNINADPFVGKVPMVPIGNNYYQFVPGVRPLGQPMMFKEQLYPRTPYYADTIEHSGRPCNGPNGCGVFGTCNNGTCVVKDQNDTVFNIKV
jgi:hypothetical protein